MAQQTAIEKMIESLNYWDIKIDCPYLFKVICDQALEKEKEQIKKAFDESFLHPRPYKTSEEYYFQTFKN